LSSQEDLLIGLGAIAVSAFAIYMFVRASGSTSKKNDETEGDMPYEEKPKTKPKPFLADEKGKLKITPLERHLDQSEVERAKSNIRTLTLQQELFGMILKRLFEAEDEGEITRSERIRLSKGYESDLKRIQEDLKKSQLIVTLHELEVVREDILKKFEETLSSTQARIDSILKELKIEAPKELPVKKTTPKRQVSRKDKTEEESKDEEFEDEEEEEETSRPKPRSEVEEKLEELRKEVLKELEELDKLEIEI
jgi:hypothetical protein